jgi:hypothetical protein
LRLGERLLQLGGELFESHGFDPYGVLITIAHSSGGGSPGAFKAACFLL